MIEFGRDICGDAQLASQKEWLVTNGIGSYASGAVSGILTRRYHGLLIAALHPPLGRTLLVTRLDETITYNRQKYSLYANHWSCGAIRPDGYRFIERFYLDGALPVWQYTFGDALVEKRNPAAAHRKHDLHSIHRFTRLKPAPALTFRRIGECS